MTTLDSDQLLCKTYQRDTMDDGELLAIISEMEAARAFLASI